MKNITLYGTTATGGALTVNATESVNGVLYAITWIDGTLTDGVDAVISTQGANASGTVLTLTNANDDAVYYPRVDSCSAAGAALSMNDALPVLIGKPRLAITGGGDAHVGGCILHIVEL